MVRSPFILVDLGIVLPKDSVYQIDIFLLVYLPFILVYPAIVPLKDSVYSIDICLLVEFIKISRIQSMCKLVIKGKLRPKNGLSKHEHFVTIFFSVYPIEIFLVVFNLYCNGFHSVFEINTNVINKLMESSHCADVCNSRSSGYEL